MAITSRLLVKSDITIDGTTVPAGEYDGIHVPPRKDMNAPGGQSPSTWMLESRYGVFDVGARILAGEIVVLMR